jgi:hypothetical protein
MGTAGDVFSDDDAQALALQSMHRGLDDDLQTVLDEAQALCSNIDEALAEEAPVPESKTRGHSPSPPESTEMVTPPSLKGNKKAGERPQKRAKDSPKVTDRELKKALEPITAPETPPDYLLVAPKEWEANKRRVGTYRYDHAAWRKESLKKNAFCLYGNRVGSLIENASYYVNLPSVVQITRKVNDKGQHAIEVFVPVPRDPTNKKAGTVLKLGSLSGLYHLCYSVGHITGFIRDSDLAGVDIIKEWQTSTNRVPDVKEAVKRITKFSIRQQAAGVTSPIDVVKPVEEEPETEIGGEGTPPPPPAGQAQLPGQVRAARTAPQPLPRQP